MRARSFGRSSCAALALAGLLLLAGCSKKAESAGKGGGGGGGGRGGGALEFPVEVASVESRPVEYTVSAVGSVEAFERVEITSRIPGAVERVHFSEGNVVGPGSLLVEIEPERYRLAVRSARATLEKAQAAEAEAMTGLKRREMVNAQNPALVRKRTSTRGGPASRQRGRRSPRPAPDSGSRSSTCARRSSALPPPE